MERIHRSRQQLKVEQMRQVKRHSRTRGIALLIKELTASSGYQWKTQILVSQNSASEKLTFDS